MSGKKHVFKMAPGQRVFNETRMRIFQGSVDGEELTWNSFDKIGFIPLDDEDGRVLDLPPKKLPQLALPVAPRYNQNPVPF